MTLHIAYTNFWPGFSLKYGLLRHLLNLAFDYDWEVSTDQKDADLVLASVFAPGIVQYPQKTIAVIWENIRPNYQTYRFSISSDFDDYSGRNVRCPLWYSQIEWFPGYRNTATDAWEHGNEPPVPLSVLMSPRTGEYVKREKFCALVASNYEPFRMMAAQALGADIYGGITGQADPRPKSEILKDYVFSLCFENSLFPGYYTEKLLHAWVAGTIPLYFADDRAGEDFNPVCYLNRNDILTSDGFAAWIKSVHNNTRSQEELWKEPLLIKEPSLDPIVEFLRKALKAINKAGSAKAAQDTEDQTDAGRSELHCEEANIASQKYEFTSDWFSVNINAWKSVLSQTGVVPSNVLEIGSYEGRSSVWIIENLLKEPDCSIVTVDAWVEGNEADQRGMSLVEERFDRNIAIAKLRCPAVRVEKRKGTSSQGLSALIAEGRRGSFDLVYVDGSHYAPDVLTDLVFSFQLCRTGGLIFCDDYLGGMDRELTQAPKLAVDSFFACFHRKLRIVPERFYQLYFQKTAD